MADGDRLLFVGLHMDPLSGLSQQLDERKDLAPAQVAAAAAALASGDVTEEAKGRFLTSLAKKGETAEEIAGFARAFRERALDPGVQAWAPQAVDIVGTGGDHSGGFNVSSMVVLLLASAGVPVMKHGNRGITSRCGSADLLAALGVKIDLAPERAAEAMGRLGFVFFFAPAYHPTFKHIGPVRKALAAQGQRTVFNILGPLLNPGRPAHVLLGVFHESWVPRLAGALDALGTGAAVAAHGRLAGGGGIDELTTASDNRIQGAGRLASLDGVWTPEEYGLPRASFDDLRGGDVAFNLKVAEAVMAGAGPAGLVDTIVFNAAVCLWLTGRIQTVQEGLGPCRELLVGGSVREKVAQTRAFYGTDPR